MPAVARPVRRVPPPPPFSHATVFETLVLEYQLRCASGEEGGWAEGPGEEGGWSEGPGTSRRALASVRRRIMIVRGSPSQAGQVRHSSACTGCVQATDRCVGPRQRSCCTTRSSLAAVRSFASWLRSSRRPTASQRVALPLPAGGLLMSPEPPRLQYCQGALERAAAHLRCAQSTVGVKSSKSQKDQQHGQKQPQKSDQRKSFPGKPCQRKVTVFPLFGRVELELLDVLGRGQQSIELQYQVPVLEYY